MGELVYTFVDKDNNKHMFAARSKSEAIEKRKQSLPGVKCEFQGAEPRKRSRPIPLAPYPKPPAPKPPAPKPPAPVRNTSVSVGRNDPCPCSSGKKYKHCCLRRH